MSGHPLLSRMREAGMLNTAGGGANSVEVELPSVHAHLQLDPDDSVSQIMGSSPRPSGRSPKQSTRSSPRRLKRTTSMDKLSAPNSTVSATQRNVKLKAVDEESVGQKGWNKLRKAVKTKKKGKKKVPIYDLTRSTTPHYRMGERDQVIAAKGEISKLKEENARLRADVTPLVREAQKVQQVEVKHDRILEDNTALRQQVIQHEAEHSRIRMMWEEDAEGLRKQVQQGQQEKLEAEEATQHLRTTVESTQRELAASRLEIKQVRAEMAEQQERAAREAAEMAERERERRVEAAREARRKDAALEEYILKLANQLEEQRVDGGGGGGGGGGGARQKDEKDEGASSYTQPSSPPSSAVNGGGGSGGADDVGQSHFACPHCQGRSSPGASPHMHGQGQEHPPPPPTQQQQQQQRGAAHIAAVDAAHREWDISHQGHGVSYQGQGIGAGGVQSPNLYYSPQQSAAAAAALGGAGVLLAEGRSSSAVERQRRAEWVQHVLEFGRGDGSGSGGGSSGSPISAPAAAARAAGYGGPVHDAYGVTPSSYELYGNAAMDDRARAREDERAAREQAREEEFRAHQARAQEREEEASRRRWAMRRSQVTSDVIRESSPPPDGGRAAEEFEFESGSARSPPSRGFVGERRSGSPVMDAVLSGRGVDAAHKFEARARQLEAEGAALRAEAEAEVAAAWASVENSGVASSSLLRRGGGAGGAGGSPIAQTNERFWPGSPVSPEADRLREELLLEEERRRSAARIRGGRAPSSTATAAAARRGR